MINLLAKKKRNNFYEKIKDVNFKESIDAVKKYAKSKEESEKQKKYDNIIKNVNSEFLKLGNLIFQNRREESEKSKSKPYLDEIFKFVKLLSEITKKDEGNDTELMVSICRNLDGLAEACNKASKATFSKLTIGAVLDDKRIKDEFARIRREIIELTAEIEKVYLRSK